MDDSEWPLRAVHRKCGHLVRVLGEPAPERVIEGMLLARPEQEIIAWLAVQATVAGMPVGAHGREVDGIDQRCVGVGSEQAGPRWPSSQEAKATAWRGLAIP